MKKFIVGDHSEDHLYFSHYYAGEEEDDEPATTPPRPKTGWRKKPWRAGGCELFKREMQLRRMKRSRANQ